MPETQPTMPEGIARTQTGEIKDQSQATETKTETKTEGTQSQENPDKKPVTDGEKSLLNQDGDKKPEPVSGAPEKYEPFKAPEGFVITDDATKDIESLFKEAGLSQAQGQKFIDYIAPQILEAIEAPFKHYQETRQEWQKEITDKYGSKLGEVKATVGRALDGLGNPKLASAFREAMDHTGAGDNPAVWDVIYEFAKKVTEGTHVKGSGPSKFGQQANSKPLSAAQAMYPNLPSAG